MIKEIKLALKPQEINTEQSIRRAVRKELLLKPEDQLQVEWIKKSIDARGRNVKIVCQFRAFINEATIPLHEFQFQEKDVSLLKEIHIIGAGPSGIFCALRCIELGLKPVIFERGKNVRERRRDLAKLNKEGVLNAESNYCFGEGGAGTYSDGKLYTRSNKRGNVTKVLEWFHFFGADKNVLYEAHPHIGTNKLPNIMVAMREKIIACGGEFHFESKLTEIEIKENKISSITINHHEKYAIKELVLATGHSANDVYELLNKHKIMLEAKSFAIGVRVEHPQHIIDSAQYHCEIRNEFLPPASYSLVEQVEGRGVFSFCMCPGGIVAPASTQQNALVVNGWSPSKRNNPYANSGMVVTVDEKDFGQQSVLSGMLYQHEIEQKAYQAGGGNFVAPAQRLTDFVHDKTSQSLQNCSYLPGVSSVKLSSILPNYIYESLAKGFVAFGKKMKGYYTEEALVIATESRTSSPVRIPRDKETLQHIQISNLYPCAEGAGYAGGIVSAAMDGMKVAEKLFAK
jgi:uncharacterized protein